MMKTVQAGAELDRMQKENEEEYFQELEESGDLKYSESQLGLDGYRYFHPETICGEAKISPSAKRKAERFVEKYDLRKHFRVNTGFLNNPIFGEMQGQIEVPHREGFPEVRLIFNRDHLHYAHCGDLSCRCYGDRDIKKHTTLCAHEAAVVLLLEEFLTTYDIGDATDSTGMRFLRGEHMEETFSENDVPDGQEPCRIIPQLSISDGRLTVSFRYGSVSGSKRPYKIKSVPEFVDKTKKREPMPFGKKWTPVLTEERLEDNSRRMYDLMRRILDEERLHAENFINRSSLYSYWGTSHFEMTFRDELPLYGRWLDEFFSIVAENAGPLDYLETDHYDYYKEKKKGKLTISPEAHRPSFLITAYHSEEGEFLGVRLTGGMGQCFYGERRAYSFGNNELAPLNIRLAKLMEPVEQAAGLEDIVMEIGRRELPEFYHKVVPQLREMTELSEPDDEEIQRYLPPEAKIFYYLDAEEDQVFGRVAALYNTRRHSLSEPLNNRPLEPYRDLDAEIRARDALEAYFPYYDEERDLFYNDREDGICQFLQDGLDRLFTIGEVRSTERFQSLGVKRTIPLNIGVSMENNLLDLKVTSDEYSEEELLDILQAYREKKKFFRLKNGNFLLLAEQENNAVAELSMMLDTMQVSLKDFVRGKMQIPAYRALYLDRMMQSMENVYADRDRHFRSLVRDFRTVEESDYEVPEALRGVLRPYQTVGYQWLRMLDHCGFGGILADDMGLGKTLQIITLIASLQGDGVSMIVTPASLVYNWREEFRRFAPELKVCTVTGTAGTRRDVIEAVNKENRDVDVLITSYDLLKRDIDAYEDAEFRFVVLDEAQYIKNARTSAARSVKLLRGQTRFALTGTPIENRLSDLWSIFDFLMPGFLFDYETFRREIETPVVRGGDEAKAEQLKRMVTPFVLRRLKQDVLKELPEKLEEIQYTSMESRQQQLYDAQVLHIRNLLAEADYQKDRFRILAELTRLRQICCDPALCFENYRKGSAKRQRCIELIRSAMEGGHKILLFSQFTSMLELLEGDLRGEGIAYYKITGATAKEKRIRMVNAFNGDDTPVFLISLKAGGTGLNLVGADIVIHYDPWWNFAAQNQATDRAHRIGQKNIVSVYKLILKDTIEERIIEMQDSKQKLSEDILGAEDISSSAIDRDELLQLLE